MVGTCQEYSFIFASCEPLKVLKSKPSTWSRHIVLGCESKIDNSDCNIFYIFFLKTSMFTVMTEIKRVVEVLLLPETALLLLIWPTFIFLETVKSSGQILNFSMQNHYTWPVFMVPIHCLKRKRLLMNSQNRSDIFSMDRGESYQML